MSKAKVKTAAPISTRKAKVKTAAPISTRKAPTVTKAADKIISDAAKKNGAKGGRRPAPPNETPRDRFNRLASERVGAILRLMPGIGKLARRDHYEATPEAIDKIEAALQGAVEREIALLRGVRQVGPGGFVL